MRKNLIQQWWERGSRFFIRWRKLYIGEMRHTDLATLAPHLFWLITVSLHRFDKKRGEGGGGPNLPSNGGNYRFGGDATHRSVLRSKYPNPANLSITHLLVINRVIIWLTSPRRLIPTYESNNTCNNSKERNSNEVIIADVWISTRSKGVTNRRMVTVQWQINLRKSQTLI